jgi:hypothetical protein
MDDVHTQAGSTVEKLRARELKEESFPQRKFQWSGAEGRGGEWERQNVQRESSVTAEEQARLLLNNVENKRHNTMGFADNSSTSFAVTSIIPHSRNSEQEIIRIHSSGNKAMNVYTRTTYQRLKTWSTLFF